MFLKMENTILIRAINPELVFKKISEELLFDVILHLSHEDIYKNAINIYYLEANLECDYILDNYFEEELEVLIKDLEDHVRLFRKKF